MSQADVERVGRQIYMILPGNFKLVLHVGSNGVDIRALAEQIVVADARGIAGEVEVKAFSILLLAVGKLGVNIA